MHKFPSIGKFKYWREEQNQRIPTQALSNLRKEVKELRVLVKAIQRLEESNKRIYQAIPYKAQLPRC